MCCLKGQHPLTKIQDLKVHSLSFLQLFLELSETVWGLRKVLCIFKLAKKLGIQVYPPGLVKSESKKPPPFWATVALLAIFYPFFTNSLIDQNFVRCFSCPKGASAQISSHLDTQIQKNSISKVVVPGSPFSNKYVQIQIFDHLSIDFFHETNLSISFFSSKKTASC